MVVRKMPFRQFIESVLNVYRTLLDIESSSDIEKTKNRTSEMVELLENPESLDKRLSDNSLSKHEMFLLASAILDGHALTAATGEDGFRPGSIDYLAESADALEAELLNHRERVEDFMFSTLVQAWHNARESTQNIKDLVLSDEFTGQRVCDFKVDRSDGGIELVECKRIHPASSDKATVDKAVGKVEAAISKAKKQLASTEAELSEEVKAKHVLIDISAYGESFDFVCHGMKIEGFKRDPEIDQILKRTEGKDIEGVDVVTLYWTNIFLQDEVVIAKTFNANGIQLSSDIDPSFEFEGFTVEIYPKLSTGQRYREVRISREVKSPARIKTTWKNLTAPSSFYTVSVPEKSDQKDAEEKAG